MQTFFSDESHGDKSSPFDLRDLLPFAILLSFFFFFQQGGGRSLQGKGKLVKDADPHTWRRACVVTPRPVGGNCPTLSDGQADRFLSAASQTLQKANGTVVC
ncbi:hypothetical protein CEXT_747871 [Caerostris extrusa]|uniref:Uncharacterized protein n=1 Tax=Caerostris extrusa TaxID=172846 RepID=A0AAV4T7E3_CAEEX|nr:hypothetical protein CEXT_747871 [Caerostris extrusa]